MTRWNRFWFDPSGPVTLGVCRLLFFGFLAFYFIGIDYRVLALAPESLWTPTSLFSGWHPPGASESLIGAVQTAWKASLVLACAGVLTRFTATIAFVLGAYILGMPNNYGLTRHSTDVAVLASFVLAASRSGDACSVDALVRFQPRHPDSNYRWPVRCLQVLISLIFFSAGLSKLRHGHLFWFSADTLSVVLLQHVYFHAPLTQAGRIIAEHPLAYRLIATATVFIELTYPLALFSLRARWLLIPASIGMLLGFHALMGPDFTLLIVCSIFWVDWGALLSRRQSVL